MKVIYWIAAVLVIIGGLNWGLVGFFDYNLVDALFGAGSVTTNVIYGAVGVSALLLIIFAPMKRKMHKDGYMKSDKMEKTEE